MDPFIVNDAYPHQKALERAAGLVHEASQTVVLTGAGVSTPSGIPDFRSPASGLWEQVNPMDVASVYSFRRQPEKFFGWIRPLTRLMLEAEPNPAHTALAQMEAMGYVHALVTQNIDMLHSRAGSQKVYEVHGHMRDATCVECFREYTTDSFIEDFVQTGEVPRCSVCGGILKPNVILFGEQLPVRVLRAAQRLSRQCDLMLVAGSSLSVVPVSNLPQIALAHGAQLIIINNEETYVDEQADVVIHDDVAQVLPRLVSLLGGE